MQKNGWHYDVERTPLRGRSVQVYTVCRVFRGVGAAHRILIWGQPEKQGGVPLPKTVGEELKT